MESSSYDSQGQGSTSPDHDPVQELKRLKKRNKVRSAWISFVGRIVAQVLGAVAMITLGLAVADRMRADRANLSAVSGNMVPTARPYAGAADDPRPSAVVLPLDAFSPDARQQLLADSLTDELIAALSGMPGIRVVSRTSSMQFRQRPRLVPQIASELQVDAVVEGGFKRDGDRIHITLRVIDGRRDTLVGSVERVRPLRDLGLREPELASSIAGELAAIIAAVAPGN